MVDDCVTGHSAFIFDRGGKRRVSPLIDLSEVSWERIRDDISTAEVVIRAENCEQNKKALSEIEPKRHELVIFRGDERVWEGPIMRVGWYHDRVEISAHDVMEYVMARPLSKEWSNATSGGVSHSAPATQRIYEIMQYELNNPFTYLASDGVTQVNVPGWEEIDPPANVWPYVVRHANTNEARTSATTEPFQMTVGEHLDNVARTGGIDYTVIGRSIHLWDVSRSIASTRQMTEADFYGPIVVTAYGADFAALAFTVSQDGRYGGAGASSDYYGPWAKIFTVYDEDETDPPTQSELNSQASRNLTGRNPVPVEVRVPDNSTVRLTDSLGIANLAPGTEVPLLATLSNRELSQRQKVHRLAVKETSDGEDVMLALVPATKPDDDSPEGQP